MTVAIVGTLTIILRRSPRCIDCANSICDNLAPVSIGMQVSLWSTQIMSATNVFEVCAM